MPFSFADLYGVPARVSEIRVQVSLKLDNRRVVIEFRQYLDRPVFDRPMLIELFNRQGVDSSINNVLFACSTNCFAATICSFLQGPSQTSIAGSHDFGGSRYGVEKGIGYRGENPLPEKFRGGSRKRTQVFFAADSARPRGLVAAGTKVMR